LLYSLRTCKRPSLPALRPAANTAAEEGIGDEAIHLFTEALDQQGSASGHSQIHPQTELFRGEDMRMTRKFELVPNIDQGLGEAIAAQRRV